MGEGRPADCGVVPEESVSEAGDDERHTGLGIAVRQLEGRALQVQHMLLVLPHTGQVLIRVCLEGGRHCVRITTRVWAETPGSPIQGPTSIELAQQTKDPGAVVVQ